MSRILCCDPGEETGWSIWSGNKLIGGGQTKLWEFAHDVWDAITENKGPLAIGKQAFIHAGVDEKLNKGKFDLFIIEKFALYPWKAKELAFDEFRTVQLIGALQFMAGLYDITVEKQSAQIKERAMAGGAGELFLKPLRENRHQNDSIMHGFYYNQVTASK